MRKSELQEQFKATWKSHGPKGYLLTPEYCFAPPRRWKFDFALEDHRIAIELEGIGGRHQFTAGFLADMEKYNEAASRGWRLLRFTSRDMSGARKHDMIVIIEKTIRLVNQDLRERMM